MFGVPIDRPSDVFCDNQSVATNVSIPSRSAYRWYDVSWMDIR